MGRKTAILTYHYYLLAASIFVMALSIVTFFYDWPFGILYLLGVDTITAARSIGKQLRPLILIYFGILTIYLFKQCIRHYRSSFDNDFNQKLRSRNER